MQKARAAHIAHISNITRVATKMASVVLTASIFFTTFPQQARAQVVSHQQLRIDDTIAIADTAYSMPTQVLVVPIFLPATEDANVADRDWFRGLYYYSIGNERRSGFTDIPFHYVVSRSGEIFKGNAGGEERKISITDVGDDVVVIGYLAARSDSAFDPRSSSALQELILDVINKNSIKPENVKVGTVRYVKDDESKTISIAKQEVFGLWNTSLNSLMEPVRRQYSPVQKTYTIQVVKVDLPAEEVKPDTTVTGKITLKNTGDFGIYPGTISELLGSRTEGASKFYMSDAWTGISQFNLIAEDKVLLPTQEKTFEFKIRVPLYFGAQSEAFVLKNAGGQVVAGSNFDLKLTVARPDGTVVEVAPTNTGWLRVRSTPSGAATELARISPGERYYVTGDAGNGWIKIKLSDGREGWVSRQFLIFL